METIEPDKLLEKSASVRLGKGLVLSLLIHLALIAATSFGLYRSWAKWGLSSEKGFHTPAVIKALEKEASRAAADQAKLDAEQAAAEKASRLQLTPEKPTQPAAQAAPAAPAPAAEAAPAQTTPYENQVSKPPKSFDLDDIDL